MTQKILNNTLCGLLAYFVLGLFLLGKGSFASAATPLAWPRRKVFGDSAIPIRMTARRAG